jgi:hypothetical protein
MKKVDTVFLTAGLISLSFFIGISACDYNEKREEETKPTKQVIETTLKGTQWRITDHYDQKASHYLKAYTFYFHKDGTVLAANDQAKINGIWSAFNASNGKIKVNFEFSLIAPVDDLNEDWVVVEQSEKKIILKDPSQRKGADEITLERV